MSQYLSYIIDLIKPNKNLKNQQIIKQQTNMLTYTNNSHTPIKNAYNYMQNMYPNRYQNTKTQFNQQDRYIKGLTRQQVSQYITSFPFIYYIYKKNQPNNQWRLLDQLMKVPSETDGPGFIYGFMNQKENTLLEAPYWIKMGRTKQNPPQIRIFQWEKDDECAITQIFTVRSLFNKKLQALVHILFSYAHQNRTINGKKRVEWFRFQQITLTAAAVNILNHIMNTIHTTKFNKLPKIHANSYEVSKQSHSLYMNRNLKQITQKINLSNNQIKDILSNDSKNTIDSFIRDLGIQLGKKQQIKLKLRDCDSISELIKLTNQTSVGKQLKQFFDGISVFQSILSTYLQKISQFRNYTLENVRNIYDKTKININIYNQSKNQINGNLLSPNINTQTKPILFQQNQLKRVGLNIFSQKKIQKSKQKYEQMKQIHNQVKNQQHKQKEKQKQKSRQDIKEKQTIKTKQKQKQKDKQKQATKTTKLAQRRKKMKNKKQQQAQKQKQKKQQKKQQNKVHKYKKQQKQTQYYQMVELKFKQQQQQQYSTKSLQIQLQNLRISQQPIEETNENKYNFKKVTEQQKKYSVNVYNAQGQHQRKQTIGTKQIQKNNQNLKKYRHARQPQIKQLKNQCNDLNQTKTEQQIQQQVRNLNNSDHTQIKFTASTLSQIVPKSTNKIGHQFIIYADTLTLDIKQLKLNCTYVILAKKIIIPQNCTIIKNDNKQKKFKGFIKIYCLDILGWRMLKIDKNCGKYVGIYKVNSSQDINIIDQYHKDKHVIGQVDRTMSMKLLQLF